MPRNTSEYQKEYRLRNMDKLRFYEKQRNAKRRMLKVKVKGVDQNDKPVEMIIAVPNYTVKRASVEYKPCEAEGCTNKLGRLYGTSWKCQLHAPFGS